MNNVPNASELVEAVAEWIETALPVSLTGAERFNARVAANTLRIVERELRAGPAHHDPDRAAFVAFLGDVAPLAPDADLVSELVRRLRAGELDARSDELLPLLHAYAVRKLTIGNPRYLSAVDQLGSSPVDGVRR